MTKSKPHSKLGKVSALLQAISPQPRLEILLAIGAGEACVCHLEASTGWRQAYISQHLMALRSDGLVVSRRDGRNIFYRLKNVGLLDLVRKAAGIAGVADLKVAEGRLSNCSCPHCSIQETRPPLGEIPNLAVGNTNLKIINGG